MRLAALLIVALPLAAGCKNSCEQICDDMAKFAESCGHEIVRADKLECYDAQKGEASKDDRQTCREFGGVDNIEAEWDCEEIGQYFDDVGGGDTDA